MSSLVTDSPLNISYASNSLHFDHIRFQLALLNLTQSILK